MNKVRVTGQLKSYLQWPLALSLMWAALVVVLYFEAGPMPALIGLIFTAVYVLIVMILYFRRKSRLSNELINFATEYGQVQKTVLQEFTLPYALLDSSGSFLWMNDEFMSFTGKDRFYHKPIMTLFPDLTGDDLPADGTDSNIRVRWDEQIIRVEMRRLGINEPLDGSSLVTPEENSDLIAVCLYDETRLAMLEAEREDNLVACGTLVLDNYDEAMEGVEEVRKSLILALAERKINQYFSAVDGVVRRLEPDRYFFLLRKKALDECEETRFAILDEIKTVNIGNELALTISAGIGLGSSSYRQNAEEAREALELALGRGGDQIVVRDGVKTRFFGGKSESAEKITRVKARVKAHALKEILESKERVVVMGHKVTDIDSLGAAIGICRAAATIRKAVHIVADDVSDSVIPVINQFREDSEYGPYYFVDKETVKSLVDASTALIVVDTNRASYTACADLLQLTNTIIVLDHHRQGDDQIRNAVLSYIEPYASSTCEMVAEILQYFDDSLKIRSMEADAMYAGIVIDTNNFVTRTGARTFEAAAYLRRNGADITRVRKMFRDDMEAYRAKAKTIADAEIFEDVYAISVCPVTGLNSPTVVSAQAANELLDVVGIQASFVMTSFHDQVYISARAIDEVNVQLIMERLGGGGHLNIAGAQLKEVTVEEARTLLKQTIIEMKKEGDI